MIRNAVAPQNTPIFFKTYLVSISELYKVVFNGLTWNKSYI
jgi:hypothetical protein